VALNAGGDPGVLLDVLATDGILEAIAASGADLSLLLPALPPEVFDLAAEIATSCFTGF
jgi:hypothetical protein